MNAIAGMLLNVSLGGLVILGTGAWSFPSPRKATATTAYPAVDNQGQNATSLIAQDLRETAAIDRATSDSLVLRSRALTTGNTITYTYNRAQGTLTREDGLTTQTVLAGVEDFAFSLLKRPGKDAPYGTFVPATADNAGLVGCRWTCARTLAGAKLGSDHVDMAPIVLRNHR